MCKQDRKAQGINPEHWVLATEDHSHWQQTIGQGIKEAEKKRSKKAAEKKRQHCTASSFSQPSWLNWTICNRDCHSRIGLYTSDIRQHRSTLYPLILQSVTNGMRKMKGTKVPSMAATMYPRRSGRRSKGKAQITDFSR